MSVTLTYGASSRTLDTYFVRGFDDADELEFWVGMNEELSDGTLIQNVIGVRRIITIGFDLDYAKADRVWMSQFFASGEMSITYANPVAETVSVVLYDPTQFANSWLDGLEYARYCEVKFRVNEIIGEVPVLWYDWVPWYDADGNQMYDSDHNPIYVKA